MQREEMLKKLQSIPFYAAATVATMDMGLEYEYVSCRGNGAGFGGMGQWPAFAFSPISSEKWNQLRRSVSDGTFTIDLLDGTDLKPFAEAILEDYYGAYFRDIDLAEMLSGLTELPETLSDRFYCLFDLGDAGYNGHKPRFFSDENELRSAFEKQYCDYYEAWEDMSDEDLEPWYDRAMDGEFDEFQYISFDESW